MMLANHVSDMSPEELFSIVKPFLYLIPIIVVAAIGFLVFTFFKANRAKRTLAFLDGAGGLESEKRRVLTEHLTHVSNNDLRVHMRPCPVCSKRYSIKTFGVNSKGERVEKWNFNGCPYCNTRIILGRETEYKRYITIDRKPTSSNREGVYADAFNRLDGHIKFYRPYIDSTPDVTDDTVTVTVTVTIN